MSKNKAKQLASHYWSKEKEEIEAAIEKATAKEMIKKEEIEEVRRRIEENKNRNAISQEETAKREAEREKAREAEKILWLQQEEEKKTKIIKTAQKPKKVEEKNTPLKRKKLQSAAVAERPKESNRKTRVKPEREKRMGRILSLRKATQRDSLRMIIKNKRRYSATIWEFPLFPEDIGIEIDTSSAVFTEKKDCFVANLYGVLIKDIPKELRYEDNLKGVFSLVVVKKVEKEWEELYLNLIYRHELNGSKPVYIARIDSEKEDPIVGSMHTTPTTNAKMILHLYPV